MNTLSQQRLEHPTWIAFTSIVRREIIRFMRIWPQTLVPPAVTMTLYFVIFGNLIGSRIGEMGGFTYMQYIVPGLIMMSVITNSYGNVASSFFSAKFQHYIEEMLVAPVPNYVIVAGYVCGGMARGLLVGLIVSLVSLFFTHMTIHNLAVLLIVVVLTSMLFSIAGLLNAIFARSFDDVSIIPNFVLTPLTYLGGVFYSLSLLPEVWQWLSKINPVVYMVSAFRYGFLGVSDVPVGLALVMICGFIGILFSVALRLITRGVGLRT